MLAAETPTPTTASLGDKGRRYVLVVGMLMTNALTFLASIVASRVLANGAYGAAASVLAIGAITSVPILSAQFGVAAQFARRSGWLTIGPALIVTSALGIGLAVVLAVASGWIDPFLHLRSHLTIAMLGLYLGCCLVEVVPRGALIGLERYGRVGVALGGGGCVRLALTLVLLDVAKQPWAPVAASAAGEAFTVAALLLAAVAERNHDRVGSLRTRALGLSVGGYTGLLAIMSIDTIAARRWLAPSLAGDYAVASLLASTSFFVIFAVSTALLPGVAKTAGSTSNDRRRGILEIAVIAFISLSALEFSARPLLIGIFGARYLHAITPLYILVVSYTVLGVLCHFVNVWLSVDRGFTLIPWAGTSALLVLVFVFNRSTIALAWDALVAGAAAAFLMLLGFAVHRPVRSRAGQGRV